MPSPIRKIGLSLKESLASIKVKGSFAQNFAFVFTGSAVGLALQVVLSPIIARLYGPEAYGTYAIFSTLVSNIGSLATLYYSNALVFPQKEEEFWSLLKLCVLTTLGFSSLIFIICLLFGDPIMAFLNAEGLGIWFYLIGPVILIHSFNAILIQWNTRLKEFKIGAYRKIAADSSAKLFNIGYGIFVKGAPAGLIIGDILGRVVGCVLLIRGTINKQVQKINFSFRKADIVHAAKQYKKYPLVVLPGNYLNTLSTTLPILMLSSAFGSNIVGNFAFTVTLLTIPVDLLGNSIRPVFLQKAVEINYTKPDELKRVTLELYKKLLILGVIPVSILTVFGDIIFSFFFGSQWVLAGQYAGYMGFFYIFSLISTPASAVFFVKGREQVMLYFHLLLLLARAGSLVIGIYFLVNADDTILLFGIVNAVLFFSLLVYLFSFLRLPAIKIAFFTLLLVAAVFAFFILVRYIIF